MFIDQDPVRYFPSIPGVERGVLAYMGYYVVVPLAVYVVISLVSSQAAQTLFVIYISDSIALRFEPFKRMYENGSKIALNSTCSTTGSPDVVCDLHT